MLNIPKISDQGCSSFYSSPVIQHSREILHSALRELARSGDVLYASHSTGIIVQKMKVTAMSGRQMAT